MSRLLGGISISQFDKEMEQKGYMHICNRARTEVNSADHKQHINYLKTQFDEVRVEEQAYNIYGDMLPDSVAIWVK